MMTLERFKTLLEAHGADIARWPADEQKQARALAETSDAARRLFETEAAFDRLLDTVGTAPVTRALEDRILASFPQRAAAPRWRPSFPIPRWIQATALACSLALGLAVGAALPSLAGVGEQSVDPALIALGSLDGDGWNDLGDGS